MKFPSVGSDVADVKAFLVQYGLTHPLVRETRQAKAFEHDGRLFILTEGVVAFQVEGDALSRRLSIAMAITQNRGYLLTWFFAAPHDSELRELMNTRMTLDPEPLLTRASRDVTDGGGTPAMTGGAAASSGGSPASSASPTASSAGSSVSPAGSVAQAPTQAAGQQSPAGNAGASDAQAAKTPAQASNTQPNAEPATNASQAQPPSLLRPGETMNDQQASGAPIPRKH
jgi:hypothetical protein